MHHNARCSLKSSPYANRGYSLREEPTWRIEDIRHRSWTGPQKEALSKLSSGIVKALIDPNGLPLEDVLAMCRTWEAAYNNYRG